MKRRVWSLSRAELMGLCSGGLPMLGFSTSLSPLARMTLQERWLFVSVHSLLLEELREVEIWFFMYGSEGEAWRKYGLLSK